MENFINNSDCFVELREKIALSQSRITGVSNNVIINLLLCKWNAKASFIALLNQIAGEWMLLKY